MLIYPYFPKEYNKEKYNPTHRVFVPFLVEDNLSGECVGLMSEKAWTSYGEAKTHHWFKSDCVKAEIKEMSLGEFMEKFRHNCDGMNPFWTLGKIEVFQLYDKDWNNTTVKETSLTNL